MQRLFNLQFCKDLSMWHIMHAKIIIMWDYSNLKVITYLPPGTMIWTNLNLHYIKKLSCHKLFRLCGSWEEDFYMTPPHFCIFVIISPLDKTWPLNWTIWNSHDPRIICTMFDWNWSAGSGEDFLKKISVYFYTFPNISPWNKELPCIWTNLNLLHLRMICANFGSGEEVENVKV
jgi:hypothetical protein